VKLAIINDTHFGARNDSQIFLDYFLDFFENQFFPYCKENKITDVIHLGDFFDRRKFINFHTLAETKRRFLDKLSEHDITLHCVLGNHDTYYRNTNRLNSIQELLSDNGRIKIYDEPSVVTFDSLDMGLVGWINSENHDEYCQFIEKCKAPILMGHFEINGYEVLRGVTFKGGLEKNIFDKFEMVLSGHFHSKHSKKNIFYLGTQYQITFNDLKDKKGFHTLDTETRDLEFVENETRMFHSITYDDSVDVSPLLESDFSKYEGSYVKIYVLNKEKIFTFDKILDKLHDHKVLNITVVEDVSSADDEDVSVDMSKDTMTIINDEIDSLELNSDMRDNVKRIVRELYMESLSL